MSAPGVPREELAAAGDTKQSPVAVVIAWAIVGVPAAWGVAQTVVKSLALFR